MPDGVLLQFPTDRVPSHPLGRTFICRRVPVRRCRWCGKPATTLCDGPATRRDGRRGTCNRGMCDDHATNVGPDKDHCPDHVRRFEALQDAWDSLYAPMRSAR